MDPVRRALLPANIEAYRRRSLAVGEAVAALVAEHVVIQRSIIDLPRACGYPSPADLLRYPVLLGADDRDAVSDLLRHRGVSCMYPAPLPGIEGLHDLLAGSGDFPAAQEFAARILTLPMHQRVSSNDLGALRDGLAVRGGNLENR